MMFNRRQAVDYLQAAKALLEDQDVEVTTQDVVGHHLAAAQVYALLHLADVVANTR